MPPPTSTRVLAAIAGLGSIVAVAWGIDASVEGFPNFAARRYFISELAMAINPRADLLNIGFVIGGGLAFLFCGLTLIDAPRGTRAPAVWGLVAAVTLMLVGVYSIARPAPHHALAGVVTIAAIGATWSLARRVTRGWRRRGVLAALVMELGCVAAAAGWVGYRLVELDAPLRDGVRVLPRLIRYQTGDGLWISPVAMLEWVFATTVAAVVVGAAIALVLGRPWALAPSSVSAISDRGAS